MTTRFPFSAFPSGWFRVGYSGELPPAKVKPLHYFGSRIMAGNMFLQVAKTPIWDLALRFGSFKLVKDVLNWAITGA